MKAARPCGGSISPLPGAINLSEVLDEGCQTLWREQLTKRMQAGRDTSGIRNWAPSRRSYTQFTTRIQR